MNRDELVTKLVDELVESFDMDSVLSIVWDDQYRFYSKHATDEEIIDEAISMGLLTEEDVGLTLE